MLVWFTNFAVDGQEVMRPRVFDNNLTPQLFNSPLPQIEMIQRNGDQ
jgi:hypothetical protein